MIANVPKGFDAALARRQDDDLDRWRFAAEIVDVIVTTPVDWSARIGIFGRWGEGKTTVLQFAQQMLRDKGNIVFMFNPWAIRSWDDLWNQFGDSLSQALEAAHIPIDSSLKTRARNLQRSLDSAGLAEIGEGVASLFGAEKLSGAAFSAVGTWLKYDGEQIRAIREKLQDQRVVVLIDDLDRCDPQLIPRLLLSLRELLDLPGFTFLLAFDDEIVGNAVTATNPAWAQGGDFLEKIIDFRFQIPPVTDFQRRRLILRAIKDYCDFVPAESTQVVQDLFPSNPRKLKTLIRSMAALRSQLNRHDPDEFNWTDMWMAQMLRVESQAFLERLLDGDLLEKTVGMGYRILSRMNGDASEKEADQTIDRVIKEEKLREAAAVRVKQLSAAIRTRASMNFHYACSMATRPQAVTWKEFRLIQESLATERTSARLAELLTKHADTRGVSINDVETEFFEALVIRRNGYLSKAAESMSIDEHSTWLTEAELLLEIIQQFLLGLNKLDAPRIRKIYDQALQWIGFRKNPGDLRLRIAEKKLLLQLFSSASSLLSTELIEFLIIDRGYPDMDGASGLRQRLIKESMAIVAPKAAQESLIFFSREGGIRSLLEVNRFIGVKHCLLSLESPIRRGDLRQQLLKLIQKGREDNVIYENVREFFDLLMYGLKSGFQSFSSDGIKGLLSDRTRIV